MELALRKKLEIDEGKDFKMIKYYNYNFEWIEVCKETIETHIKVKNSKKNNKQNQKGKKNDQPPKNHKKTHAKDASEKPEKKVEESKN